MGSPKRKAPAPGAAGAGALSKANLRVGTQIEEYTTGLQPATVMDFDSFTPQPVSAFVSKGSVYVLDESYRVIAFGILVRRVGE